MQRVITSTVLSHPRTTFAVDSGPLSERMCPGTSRRTNKSDNRSRTSSVPSFLATSIARHSLANLSMALGIHEAKPDMGKYIAMTSRLAYETTSSSPEA